MWTAQSVQQQQQKKQPERRKTRMKRGSHEVMAPSRQRLRRRRRKATEKMATVRARETESSICSRSPAGLVERLMQLVVVTGEGSRVGQQDDGVSEGGTDIGGELGRWRRLVRGRAHVTRRSMAR
jgi:hypothetical protein